MTTIPPERLAALIMALERMADEDSRVPMNELIRLAEVIDAQGKLMAQLHPLHTTVQ